MDHNIEKIITIRMDHEEARALNAILREIVPSNTKFTSEECAALQDLKDILTMY